MAYREDAPASLTLPASHQAVVAQIIEATGLDASEFVWAVQPSRYHLIGMLVSALMHTPTGASFKFDFLESPLGQNRVSIFTTGRGPEETRAAGSWEDQVGQLRQWLTRLADAKK